MEGQRTTRGRPIISASEPPPRARSPRKSPARKSPARRSPARKAPARKSPARKSPARKSPARTKSPIQKEEIIARPSRTNKKPTATVPPTSPPKETKEKAEKKTPPSLATITRPPISISPIKRDLKGSSSLQSISTSSYSSSTRTTIKTKATVDTTDFGQNRSSDRSGDLEVSKLTSLASFIRRSVSKNPTPTTELTRQSRSVSHSVYDDDDNYSKTEYSDNEQDNYETIQAETSRPTFAKRSIARQIEVPKEFGGAIGAALILLLIPPATLYLQYSCETKLCKFKCVNFLLTTFASISSLFDSIATGSYISFVILVHLLSALPMGRIVRLQNDRGTLQYYFNSIFAAIVVVSGLGIGEYFKYPVIIFISKHFLKFSLLSILTAFALSLCALVRSRSVSANLLNPYGKSGNFLIDFFIGREIQPKWFGVIDIKLACYRTSLISTLVLSLVLVFKNLKFPALPTGENALDFTDSAKYLYENAKYDTAGLFACGLLLTYVLDLIINEHHLASSFDLQQEGVGALLLLRYAVTPFLLAIVPRYAIINRPIDIPLWGYGLILFAFLAGLIIKRASSAIKYQYRMNPTQPSLVLADTVPTFQGRRLLLDKWWGSVRQPNYIGDIISLIAYGALVSWNFAYPPALSILLIVIFLIHRAIRVNARNFRRYNSAWSRYCTRVRHLLVPKVF